MTDQAEPASGARRAHIDRVTSESSVSVELNLDGTGQVEVSTGVRFYDHLLTAFGVHGALDLTVRATGDVDIASIKPENQTVWSSQ